MREEMKVIEKINKKIESAVKKFSEDHMYDKTANASINGMLEALEIFTGKEYFYDETGVHEK